MNPLPEVVLSQQRLVGPTPRALAAKESQRLIALTLGSFSSVVHLNANQKTPEHAQTPWKAPTDLSKLTFSSLDPLVM
jgi:hypothetical protein